MFRDELDPLNISEIYRSPKHTNKFLQFEGLFRTIGNKFFTYADYNANNII